MRLEREQGRGCKGGGLGSSEEGRGLVASLCGAGAQAQAAAVWGEKGEVRLQGLRLLLGRVGFM